MPQGPPGIEIFKRAGDGEGGAVENVGVIMVVSTLESPSSAWMVRVSVLRLIWWVAEERRGVVVGLARWVVVPVVSGGGELLAGGERTT